MGRWQRATHLVSARAPVAESADHNGFQCSGDQSRAIRQPSAFGFARVAVLALGIAVATALTVSVGIATASTTSPSVVVPAAAPVAGLPVCLPGQESTTISGAGTPAPLGNLQGLPDSVKDGGTFAGIRLDAGQVEMAATVVAVGKQMGITRQIGRAHV